MFDPNEELPVLAPEATHERYEQLREYATAWAYEHGWMVYEGISDDITGWADENHSVELTEDDLDTVLNLLETATFTTGTVNGEKWDENEPRYYWDRMTDYDETDGVEIVTAYGKETCRIIDLESGGVIAYVHELNADRIIMALRAAG